MYTEEDALIQIYYDKEEIKANQENQQKDQFEDLMRMRMTVARPQDTGINILDHLPNQNNSALKDSGKSPNQKIVEMKKRKNVSMNLKVQDDINLSDDNYDEEVPIIDPV